MVIWFSASGGSGGTSAGSTCATTSATMYANNIYTTTTATTSTCTDTIWITTPGGASYYVTGVSQHDLQQQLINQYNQGFNPHHQQILNQYNQGLQNQQELHRDNRYAQAQEEEMQAARERAEQAAKEMGEARKRAHALLLEHLTPAQRETFEKNKWFIVEGGKTGKRFKIFSNGYAGNVHELDAHDRMVNRLCCHANAGIPLEDQLLTQKVLLEWDEEHFYKTANITRIAA